MDLIINAVIVRYRPQENIPVKYGTSLQIFFADRLLHRAEVHPLFLGIKHRHGQLSGMVRGIRFRVPGRVPRGPGPILSNYGSNFPVKSESSHWSASGQGYL